MTTYPTTTVTTPYGTVEVTATDADHAMAVFEDLKINGVSYRGRISLNTEATPGTEHRKINEEWRWNYWSVTRVDSWNKSASEAAGKKIKQEVLSLVVASLNATTRTDAQMAADRSRLESAKSDLARLTEQAATIQAEIDRLTRALGESV